MTGMVIKMFASKHQSLYMNPAKHAVFFTKKVFLKKQEERGKLKKDN